MTVIRSQCKDDDEYMRALRDDFAAAALQGYGQNMLVMSNAIEGWKDTGRGGTRETCIAEYIAGLSYEVADAMLAARERK